MGYLNNGIGLLTYKIECYSWLMNQRWMYAITLVLAV